MTATYDVFLSYDRSDKHFAYELAGMLKRAGLTVWFDREELPPGAAVNSSLVAGLEASSYFVPIITDSWLTSEYCRWEADAFLEGSSHPETVVPILRGPRSAKKLGPVLSRLNAIDWPPTEPEPMARLWELLCSITEREPGPVDLWAQRGRSAAGGLEPGKGLLEIVGWPSQLPFEHLIINGAPWNGERLSLPAGHATLIVDSPQQWLNETVAIVPGQQARKRVVPFNVLRTEIKTRYEGTRSETVQIAYEGGHLEPTAFRIAFVVHRELGFTLRCEPWRWFREDGDPELEAFIPHRWGIYCNPKDHSAAVELQQQLARHTLYMDVTSTEAFKDRHGSTVWGVSPGHIYLFLFEPEQVDSVEYT